MTLSWNSNGILPDSHTHQLKIILDHSDDLTDDLNYSLVLHRLESRGVNLYNVIITAISLLRYSNYGYVMYHDALNQNVSSIRYNAVLKQRSNQRRQGDLVEYLQDAFAPIPQDYTWSVNRAPREEDIKWMINHYHDFFKANNFNAWVQPSRVIIDANMLIIEGWYDVY